MVGANQLGDNGQADAAALGSGSVPAAEEAAEDVRQLMPAPVSLTLSVAWSSRGPDSSRTPEQVDSTMKPARSR